jgi:predicted transcriptional regulator
MFRNMTSEPKPQPASGLRHRSWRGERPGARRPDQARGKGPGAGFASAPGGDPEDPVTRPGGAPGVPAGFAPAAAPAEGPDDREPVKLTDAKGMRALAHPVRMALLELFNFRETLTATQASELLGESPANCAFHLRTLAKYGFVREAGGGRGRERPWALTARSITVTATGQADPQAALAADALARYWLERWTGRAMRVYGPRNQVPGWDEASGWSNSHVYLTPDEAVSLRAEMRRMLSRYEDRLGDPSLRPDGALPVEWTIFTSPVTEAAELSGLTRASGAAAQNAADPDAMDSQLSDIS